MTSPAPSLARTDLCPDCGSVLPGATCARCGLELVGPTAVRLLAASREADRWLGERRRLVRLLRTEAAGRRTATSPKPVPQPVARVVVPAQPPTVTMPAPPPPRVPLHQPPVPLPPAPQPPARRAVLSVQSLLVGLGALLLAVASVVFLAFSWDRLGITGRSVVVATMTLTVLSGAVLARRARMQLTAEAVGALGAVLVVLDAVAVRVTGLAGEGMGRLTYAATAALVCAAVLAGVARLGRLRSLGCAAAALVALAPVLLGTHLALDAPQPDALAWLAAGLLAAALPAVLAGPLAARGATAEATVLTWAGAAGAACAAVLLLVVGPWEPWQGAALAAAGALVAVLHLVVPGARAPRTWAAAAGACAAVAVALLATHALGTWALLGAPMGVGLVALALRQVASPTGRVLVAARSALAVLAVAAAPAALVVVLHPLTVTVAALQPWSAGAAEPWSLVTGVDPGDLLPATDRTASFVAVLAVAGVLAGWWRASGTVAVRRTAAVVLAVLVVCLPWQLDLPVLHVVVTALLLAVGAAAGGHLLRRRSGWVVEGTTQLAAGAAVGVLGVLAAWTVQPLSVRVTLLGVAALVLARRASGRALLDVPATAAALVALGGAVAWTGAATADAALVATLGGALVVAAVSLVPDLPSSDRRAVGATGVVALVLSVGTSALAPLTAREPRLLLVLVAAVVAAAVVASDPARVWRAGERAAASAVLVPLAALAGLVGVRVGARSGGALAQVDPVLAAAVVVAASLAAAASLHRGRRVLAPVVEASAATSGAVVLAVALAGLAGLRPEPSWPLLVVLAVGTAALSVEPARRWVAWVALVLASGALWDRLAAADVGTVEAFSLPPALVLLVAGAVGARRDGVVARPSTVTGLALLVLPTAVASVGGPAARPVVLLVVAALAVLFALLALGDEPGVPAPGRVQASVLLLASAVAGVLAGPVLRSLGDGAVAEVWAVPSAAVLVGATAVLARVPGAGRPVPWALLAGLLVATVPSLLAGDRGPAAANLARHLVPLAVAGALLVHGSGAVRRAPVTWGALAVLSLAVLAGAARGLAGPVELLTVPAAAALALAGVRRMRVRPEQGSWPWTGPAAALALLPSLLLATTGGPVLRTTLLAAGAAAVLLVGVARGWQAPVVVGSLVLAVHAVVQLSPFVALAYEAVPRWASLALVGLVLLALGARYEARVRDVVSLRRRVATLR
jgi:hypothetical protein